MRLLIIGGDAAGMSAASEARRQAPEAEIVVLEATEDVSYGACGLPYKLSEDADMEDLTVISPERFRQERKLDLRLGHRATELAVDRHEVQGIAGSEPFSMGYDRLVLATGARAIRPPIEGLDELWGTRAFHLKTLQDGRDVKAALAGEPRTVAVLGAGYIGLEVTENLRERGLAVRLIEAADDVTPFLPEDQRRCVREEAEHRGVDLRLGTKVERVRRDGSRIVLTAADGSDLDADLLIVAVGVQPNAELAARAGLDLGDRGSIAVDEHLFTSAADVLAAGDCADAKHGLTGQSTWIPLALRANRAGKLAGRNALGERVPAPPIIGTAVFKFFDLEIARTGLSEAEARDAGFDAVTATMQAPSRAHYYPGGGKLSIALVGDRRTGKLLGGTMVGPEAAAHKIDTLVAALHMGLTPKQLYDMDLAYAPPFGAAWSPLLIAARLLDKKLRAGAP